MTVSQRQANINGLVFLLVAHRHCVGDVHANGIFDCGSRPIVVDQTGLVLGVEVPATFLPLQYLADANADRYVKLFLIPVIAYDHVAITDVPATAEPVVQERGDSQGVGVAAGWWPEILEDRLTATIA